MKSGAFLAKCMLSLILLTSFFTGGKLSATQLESISIADQVYSATYHFQFLKADSLIRKNDAFLKSDPEYNLAVVNYYWYRLISGEENKKYSTLISARIRNMEPLLKNAGAQVKDQLLFLMISISAYKARVSLLDYSYFSAMSDLSNYYALLKKSFGLEESYHPFFLTTGLYLFFTGYAKEKVPVLTPLLNHYNAGNKDVGIQYLKIASNSEDWKVRQEARYFLMKVYFDVYHNYRESAKYCNMLLAEYPENLLFQYYILKISLGVNQIDNARNRMLLLEKAAGRNLQLTSGERSYYIGEARKAINKH
jgi:hypothetical protein